MLLLLEDDRERIGRFQATLLTVAPSLPLKVWRSARQMIREVEPFLPAARLISLDHDLEPAEGDEEDPGDGIDVARFLAVRPPVCPVIIHTSNRSRSDWMIGEFELGGWSSRRVAPIGDDWIESYWGEVVGNLLAGIGPARNESRRRSRDAPVPVSSGSCFTPGATGPDDGVSRDESSRGTELK
jgi:hypothetical protein